MKPFTLMFAASFLALLTFSHETTFAQRRMYLDDISLPSELSRFDTWRANTNLEMGVRYLKLGNTYREARQYGLAQSYLRYGLDIVRAQGNRYWEAVGNEYAGLVFRDMGDNLTALDYLRQAEFMYREVLTPMRSETSVDAIRKMRYDVELDNRYGLQPIQDNTLYAYQTENQRLRDINRALQLRITDLETRIRAMEMPVVGR
jgi:tetratricopeptide (TPR) repeat protein